MKPVNTYSAVIFSESKFTQTLEYSCLAESHILSAPSEISPNTAKKISIGEWEGMPGGNVGGV